MGVQFAGGWRNDPREVDRITRELGTITEVAPHFRATGVGAVMCLWDFWHKALGDVPHYVGQGYYDCTSFAARTAIDICRAVQICDGSGEQWVAETATEPIYGGARSYLPWWARSFSSGATTAAAARWCNKYGVLLRQKYGKYDFTVYSSSTARAFRNGTPKALLPIAAEHPVQAVARIRSYDEARDAIVNGHPVTVGSNQGFDHAKGRDADGFLAPKGTNSHSMCFIGVDDAYSRPGLFCFDSKGETRIKDQLPNPKRRYNYPVAGFWVDADVADKMLRSDAWAYSSVLGWM